MTIQLKIIKRFFKKTIWIIGKNPFTAFFVLFFLSLIIGGLIFYQYSFLPEKKKPQAIKKPLQFKEDLFWGISQEWQIRQEKFEEVASKEYPNLFRSAISEELTE